MSISRRCFNLEYTIIDVKQCYIKGSSTQIKHQYCFFAILFIQSICNSCSSGFVNDTLHSESSNGSSILSSLTLGIVEICRYSDNSSCNLRPNKCFGCLLHLTQNHTGYFLGTKFLIIPLGSCAFHNFDIWFALLIANKFKGKE
mmetsp:Transcript_22237/g.33898  ORF Transcript_22237/g.33898 Transcript_22237/m.33898 type:complete len:144 (+) Transcript_22237:1596-2027(+)